MTKLIIVLIAVVILDGEPMFLIQEAGFKTMEECQRRQKQIADPRVVCGQPTEAYVSEVFRGQTDDRRTVGRPVGGQTIRQ